MLPPREMLEHLSPVEGAQPLPRERQAISAAGARELSQDGRAEYQFDSHDSRLIMRMTTCTLLQISCWGHDQLREIIIIDMPQLDS